MSDTIQSEFIVTDLTDSDVWLKQRFTGLHVAVERTRVNYSTDVQQKLRELSKGMIIAATLESIVKNNTAWKFNSLTIVNRPVT